MSGLQDEDKNKGAGERKGAGVDDEECQFVA